MDFKKLVTNKDVLRAITDLKYEEATDIQIRAIPLIQQGKDVVGQAFTGSGKTMAFSIPLVESLKKTDPLRVLIMVPTRELCQQIAGEIAKVSKYNPLNIVEVYGGVAIGPQIDGVKKAQIIVGTPGRLLDLLSRRALQLDQLTTLVLDEADRMLDMGFIDDIRKIIKFTPVKRQTLLFSATFTPVIRKIIKNFMKNPIDVKVKEFVDKSLLSECYYSVTHEERFSLLVHLLKREKSELVLIFTGSRKMSELLTHNLKKQGFDAQALHGGMTQAARTNTMQSFQGNKLHILVATDVAARGIDIKNVTHIYNFDIPKTDKDYLHRVGRTARAGSSGTAISLLSQKDYENYGRVVANKSIKIERIETPFYKIVPFSTRIPNSRGFRGSPRGPPRGRPRSGGRSRGPPRGRSGGRGGPHKGKRFSKKPSRGPPQKRPRPRR